MLVNSKFEQLVAAKSDDILGRNDYDVFTKEIADEFSREDKVVI